VVVLIGDPNDEAHVFQPIEQRGQRGLVDADQPRNLQLGARDPARQRAQDEPVTGVFQALLAAEAVQDRSHAL
jgi:hypothetical protein